MCDIRRRKHKVKKTKENEQKKETIPPIKISLKGNIAKIIKSPVENLIYSEKLQIPENLSSSAEKIENYNIADKVKLRKRGQKVLSGVEIFKTCSESHLPAKRRRKGYGSTSSLSSPSSNSLSSSQSYRTDYSSSSSVSSPSYADTCSRMHGEKRVISDGDFPHKKAKLSMNCNEQLEDSAAKELLDIHLLDVASYEEVSTEPGQISPEPSEICVKNEIDAMSVSKGVISTCSPNEEDPLLNTTSAIEKKYADILNEIKIEASAFRLNQKYPIEEIDYDIEEFNNFQSSTSEEENRIHKEELQIAHQSCDSTIRAMINLAIEIIPNEVYNQIMQSTEKYSREARLKENVMGLENKMDSTTISTKQVSRSPSGHALTSKSLARDYRNTHDNNGGFRQGNHAAEEKRKAIDERCIVYVGNIPHGYSDVHLKERFKEFGTIKDIQIKSKVRCDFNSSGGQSLESVETRNYGFLTFSSNQEAAYAIEKGNEGHELKLNLSFGARRHFVGEEYKDLDGIVAKNENSLYKRNSTPLLPQNKDDYQDILQSYIAERGVTPQRFTRMQCKA